MVEAWQPACSLEMLHARATLLRDIREFFHDRSVLEVETPLLSLCCGTDPQLDFFTTTFNFPPTQQTLYLQTSPEFAMKRLLAAGCGSIFQICKSFRNGETGRYHNPEFTMLEWYRVGFSLKLLMNEIDELIRYLDKGRLLSTESERISYQDAFKRYTGLDALEFSAHEYAEFAEENNFTDAVSLCGNDHRLWLDLLFSHQVQPHLGKNAPCLVYGFPACQSSLARVNDGDPRVTDRVELFINGIELGNGYFELTDAEEQESRFDREIAYRTEHGLPAIPKDKHLLAALHSGLPDCSGMAIGLDRLLMVLMAKSNIHEVLALPISMV